MAELERTVEAGAGAALGANEVEPIMDALAPPDNSTAARPDQRNRAEARVLALAYSDGGGSQDAGSAAHGPVATGPNGALQQAPKSAGAVSPGAGKAAADSPSKDPRDSAEAHVLAQTSSQPAAGASATQGGKRASGGTGDGDVLPPPDPAVVLRYRQCCDERRLLWARPPRPSSPAWSPPDVLATFGADPATDPGAALLEAVLSGDGGRFNTVLNDLQTSAVPADLAVNRIFVACDTAPASPLRRRMARNLSGTCPSPGAKGKSPRDLEFHPSPPRHVAVAVRASPVKVLAATGSSKVPRASKGGGRHVTASVWQGVQSWLLSLLACLLAACWRCFAPSVQPRPSAGMGGSGPSRSQELADDERDGKVDEAAAEEDSGELYDRLRRHSYLRLACSPLSAAAALGHGDMVERLLAAGAQPDPHEATALVERGACWVSPLAAAALWGDTEIVRLLLSGGNRDRTGSSYGAGGTRRSNGGGVERARQPYGASPNSLSVLGSVSFPPLLLTPSWEIMRALIKAGARPELARPIRTEVMDHSSSKSSSNSAKDSSCYPNSAAAPAGPGKPRGSAGLLLAMIRRLAADDAQLVDTRMEEQPEQWQFFNPDGSEADLEALWRGCWLLHAADPRLAELWVQMGGEAVALAADLFRDLLYQNEAGDEPPPKATLLEAADLKTSGQQTPGATLLEAAAAMQLAVDVAPLLRLGTAPSCLTAAREASAGAGIKPYSPFEVPAGYSALPSIMAACIAAGAPGELLRHKWSNGQPQLLSRIMETIAKDISTRQWPELGVWTNGGSFEKDTPPVPPVSRLSEIVAHFIVSGPSTESEQYVEQIVLFRVVSATYSTSQVQAWATWAGAFNLTAIDQRHQHRGEGRKWRKQPSIEERDRVRGSVEQCLQLAAKPGAPDIHPEMAAMLCRMVMRNEQTDSQLMRDCLQLLARGILAAPSPAVDADHEESQLRMLLMDLARTESGCLHLATLLSATGLGWSTADQKRLPGGRLVLETACPKPPAALLPGADSSVSAAALARINSLDELGDAASKRPEDTDPSSTRNGSVLVNPLNPAQPYAPVVRRVLLPGATSSLVDRFPKFLNCMLGSRRVPMQVWASEPLEALVMSHWSCFTQHVAFQMLLLRLAYTVVFIVYALSLTDAGDATTADDGGSEGQGTAADSPSHTCPSAHQHRLMVALIWITSEYVVIELRQIWASGLLPWLRHPWNLFDAAETGLMAATLGLHWSCGASVDLLRGLSQVLVLVLFWRLMQHASTSRGLGSFVRMVLEVTYDLRLFFVFLGMVYVGFGVALMVVAPNGCVSSEGLGTVTAIVCSLYMLFVTIILLNLLIAIIGDVYERVLMDAEPTDVRNKALAIAEIEQLMPKRLRRLRDKHLLKSKYLVVVQSEEVLSRSNQGSSAPTDKNATGSAFASASAAPVAAATGPAPSVDAVTGAAGRGGGAGNGVHGRTMAALQALEARLERRLMAHMSQLVAELRVDMMRLNGGGRGANGGGGGAASGGGAVNGGGGAAAGGGGGAMGSGGGGAGAAADSSSSRG
ncbi:hypothetical protein HYH03_013694 [Edaphochlamys debaryana]|uniref:Ion transport domain-containing protein n=1 Tax=Edaphochlamys debaryana TaxID=47281 RepID=A0A835XQC0_9CHLO|nr:hypothetical protein HYH03_013694 [Edaphochlamys debaryana]|eukprot:KAG2487695.1 hypothetical protein HYH03_013694 [Edaphochlamys debaryana]